MTAPTAPAQPLWRDPAFWVLVLTTVLLAQVCAWYARLYHHNVIDDAYISFQYAKNLSLGRGLVFNPGELVEGYTNFLWVMLLAPLFAVARLLHLDPTRTAIGLNLLLAMGCLSLIYFVGRRIPVRGAVGLGAALVLTAFDNGYQGYAISGLENHLVASCMLAALLAWLSPARWSQVWTGVWLGMATLARPDAGLFALAFGVMVATELLLVPGGARRSLAARGGLSLLVWAALTGAWFVWRMRYYGEWLPNTFHLKVGSSFDAVSRGWQYTLSFLDDRYYVPLAALVALRWARLQAVRWMLGFVALHVAWIVFVGGDFYSGHRFYVVLLPVVYLLAGFSAGEIVARVGAWGTATRLRTAPRLRTALLVVVGCASAWSLFRFTLRGMERGPYTREILRWGRVVNDNVRFMRWFAGRVKPGESMVVGDIGSAGFLADVRVVDVLGVVDPVVARADVAGFGKGKPGHEKWAERQYLLDKRPTYVKWPWIEGDLHASGYYLFTDFPPGIEAEGLWVKDELEGGRYLPETAIHFEPGETASWEGSGDAFSTGPGAVPSEGAPAAFGSAGGYLDSRGDRSDDEATGRLLSPPFELVGDKVVLRVGGGRDAQNLRVSLLVDSHLVGSCTGHGREILGRRVWEISALKGKHARVEVVDDSKSAMGHILVDEMVQWVRQ